MLIPNIESAIEETSADNIYVIKPKIIEIARAKKVAFVTKKRTAKSNK